MIEAVKFSENATELRKINITDPVAFLKGKYMRGYVFGLDDLMSSGIYKLYGWYYDLTPYLKQYLVRQYGSWQEYFAPNKTSLRKVLYGRVDKILEIKE